MTRLDGGRALLGFRLVTEFSNPSPKKNLIPKHSLFRNSHPHTKPPEGGGRGGVGFGLVWFVGKRKWKRPAFTFFSIYMKKNADGLMLSLSHAKDAMSYASWFSPFACKRKRIYGLGKRGGISKSERRSQLFANAINQIKRNTPPIIK